jgi:exodeoxyribonuclease-5
LNLINNIKEELNYLPTTDQENLIYGLHRFTISQKVNPILIVNGYAGTGKTSLISSYVKTLKSLNLNTVLLAPTGRAAKVFYSFANKKAFTIHKQIYQRSEGADGRINWNRTRNKNKNTTYIIDEASMIPGQQSLNNSGFSSNTLLEDLLEYVFEQKGNRLILIGDMAQLPPVGEKNSPALDPEYVSTLVDSPIARITLKEVVRQELNSGILHNATLIRYLIDSVQPAFPKLVSNDYADVEFITGYELQDLLEETYDQFGIEEMVFITWSNKRANGFNQQIRSRVLWMEEELNAGDRLMVVKNNYFWLENDFIANGDVLEVHKVIRETERYGFKFADLLVHIADNDNVTEFEIKVLLDVLSEEGPALSSFKQQDLFSKIEEDHADISNRKKRYRKIMESPWFNAIQIKYAYAVTSHKSQGGQWPVVFLEAPYLREPEPGIEDLRWLYTGFTRASKKLYLVNFPEQYLYD